MPERHRRYFIDDEKNERKNQPQAILPHGHEELDFSIFRSNRFCSDESEEKVSYAHPDVSDAMVEARG